MRVGVEGWGILTIEVKKKRLKSQDHAHEQAVMVFLFVCLYSYYTPIYVQMVFSFIAKYPHIHTLAHNFSLFVSSEVILHKLGS